MKVNFIGKANLFHDGIMYVRGESYDISATVFKEFTDSFVDTSPKPKAKPVKGKEK